MDEDGLWFIGFPFMNLQGASDLYFSTFMLASLILNQIRDLSFVFQLRTRWSLTLSNAVTPTENS